MRPGRGGRGRARALALASALWLSSGAISLRCAPAWAAPAEDHFRVGLQLFQTGNYTGALAEFEEAYRLHPTPSSLQNVALCQRAIFRYAESIATLERMLRDHADTVDAEDARAAREAIVEMNRLVATVRLSIDPPTATVTIDGRPVEGAAERLVRLNVGEHRVVATAPRHLRSEQSLTFAGGERALAIRLQADAGTATLETEDPTAALEVDGTFRAFGSWTGELSAGQPHAVRVHQDGRALTTTEVTLERGERRTVRIPRGASDSKVRSPYSAGQPPAPVPPRSGPYGLLTATSYTLFSHPDGFRPRGTDSNGASTHFGLRAGYRFTTLFGLEGLVETGNHAIGPGCYDPAKTPDDCPADTKTGLGNYQLTTRRVGGSARFMTGSDRFRFLATTGVGLVYHELSLQPDATNPADVSKGSSYQAFVLLEAGAELSFGRALVGGMLSVAIDGANNLLLGNNGERAFTGQRNIGMVGIGLRLGYGHWLTPCDERTSPS